LRLTRGSRLLDFSVADSTGPSSRAYRFGMTVLGAFVVLFILAMKSTALHAGGAGVLFLVYSVLVTSFELSRLVAATLHTQSSDACYKLAAVERHEPTVTFLIPCMNEERAIEVSVANSFAADYPKEKLEVIVVDDGSTDGTPAVLRELQDRYRGLQVITFGGPAGRSSSNSTPTAISTRARSPRSSLRSPAARLARSVPMQILPTPTRICLPGCKRPITS
jgi:cellulose synthase/poly-beta-1,6-N-acetylglucosamine synthase-like glycosyltransferase